MGVVKLFISRSHAPVTFKDIIFRYDRNYSRTCCTCSGDSRSVLTAAIKSGKKCDSTKA